MTNQSELEKKHRELKEREQVLKVREDLLAQEKIDIDKSRAESLVLDKQIEAKQGMLNSLTTQLDKASIELNVDMEVLLNEKSLIKQSIKAQEAILESAKKQEIILNTNIRSKKIDLSDLKDQIKETREYFKEQEKLTENTINEWNDTLVEFHKEAETIQSEKNKLSAAIIRLEQDKLVMVTEFKSLEDKIESLNESYDQRVDSYRGSLRELDTELNAKREKLSILNDSIETRMLEINTREKSLKLKEGAANAKESDLNQKERRLKQNYGMAELEYDV